MLRKINYFFSVLAIAATVSCSDSDPVSPNVKPEVLAPPLSIDVRARLEYCITTSPTIDIYHRVNSGTWQFVGNVSSTSCGSIGTISASVGDVVEFYVVDHNTADWYSYRGRIGGCPNTTYTGYCGGPAGGTYYPATIAASTSMIGLQLNVSHSYPDCGTLAAC